MSTAKHHIIAIPIIGALVCLSALYGCASVKAEVPDAEEEPPDVSEGAVDTVCDALRVSIDGNELGILENAEAVDRLSELLCNGQKEHLEEMGLKIEEIRVSSKLDISNTECPAHLISNAEDTAGLIMSLGIDVSYEVKEVVLEAIPFSTVYKNSSLYYEGTRTVETVGKVGEKRSVYKASYVGDNAKERELMSEETLAEATDELVLVGTKKSTVSTGTYAWPTKSVYVTSYYGWRTINGVRGYHYGIDLRASVGTAIYAADGGEVIYCGTASGYGKLIKIRHDNGDITYYAHLSAYSVSVGTRVYKGQQIAKSGNTGRTTGPHLHFEIRKGGSTRVDPLKYLPAF